MHGHLLEQHLFPSKLTEPYAYSGECANFIIQILNYLIDCLESCSEDEINEFKNLINLFIKRCINIKILLQFTELLEEKAKDFDEISELLKERVKGLSEKTIIIKTIQPKKESNPGCLSKKNFSIGKFSPIFDSF